MKVPRFLLAAILIVTPATALIDVNENGLSDLWERQFNGGELFSPSFDPEADPDRDGWSNLEEAAAGTNPFDANPPLGFVRTVIEHVPATYLGVDGNGDPVIDTPEAVRITWDTLPGKSYAVECSGDLTPGSWLPLGDAHLGDGDPIQTTVVLTQPDGSVPERLFWRVRIGDVDTDGDGLTDAEEFALGTDPSLPDTDGDGWDDRFELLAGTSATLKDTDSDGLDDPEDTDPGDSLVAWRSSRPVFAVIENVVYDADSLIYDDHSANGTMLFHRWLNGVKRIVVIDRNQGFHEFSSDSAATLVYARSLYDDLVPCERLGSEKLWNPLDNSYQAWNSPTYYHDDILDVRDSKMVARSWWDDPELGLHVSPDGDMLPGESGSQSSAAYIDQDGNICSDKRYWKIKEDGTYGSPLALPVQGNVAGSHAHTAVFTQAKPNGTIGTWRLACTNAEPGLMIAAGNGGFAKATGIFGNVSFKAVTRQGWLFDSQGRAWTPEGWQPFKSVLDGDFEEAALVAMHDTGVGVAITKKPGESRKVSLLVPVEIRGYEHRLTSVSIGFTGSEGNRTSVEERERKMINDASDATGFRTGCESELKIAQWSEMYDYNLGSGNWSFDGSKLNQDLDAFYVRVPSLFPAPPGQKHRFKVWTTDESGGTLDAGAEIELEPQPGSFQSGSLCLVASDGDDALAIGGKNDGDLNDPTFKAELGGKVKFQWLTCPGGASPVVEMDVPVKKVVTVQGYIFQGGFFSTSPAIADPEATRLLNETRDVLATCGIKLNINPNINIDPNPSGVVFDSLSDSNFELPIYSGSTGIAYVSQESKNLMDDSRCVPPQDVIPVFYVKKLSPIQDGMALPSSALAVPDKKYSNRIFMDSGRMTGKYTAVAHEMMHILLDAAHGGPEPRWLDYYENKKWCIWANNDQEDGVFRRRVIDSMRFKMLRSSLCKNP